GGKALFTADGVTETVRLIGQEGAWGSSIGAGGTVDYNWTVDQDNTIWAILQMSFDDYLVYLVDEWGDATAENIESLDPTVTQKISFEVKSNAAVGGESMEYWWSSEDNNAYQSVYWNGYLEFSEEVFFPVSTEKFEKSNKLAYIYDNTLRFKGFDKPVNLEIYSIVGQKVMSAKNVSTLNVSGLDKGIYLVKVDGEKQAFKVMK
ncbi:MAG: T9SS type A sorting domain-containing protein, partial [bacterium]